MSPDRDGSRPDEPDRGAASAKRPYVPPTLEKLGTIRELTRGLGSKTTMDGAHPPGLNKSIG